MSDEPMTIRKALPRINEAIATQGWAITAESMDLIQAIALRQHEVDVEALEKIQARRAAGAYDLRVRDGVGILDVQGPMFRYANLFTMISGGASYQMLMLDLERARNDPNIRSILLNMDSPGGEVNGCAELAAAIEAAGKVKPVEAYVGGQACSACFWLACATNKITMASTAYVGSIGVRMGIRDSSERDSKSGVRTVEFISSRAPNKRLDFESDEGRGRIQRYVDATEDVFIAAVARYRGVSEETVAQEFGGGGVEVGQAAVDIGMADALGSFEDVFSRMSAGNGVTANGRRKPEMTTAAQTPPAGTFSQADLDKARTEALAEGRAAAEAEAAARAEAARKEGETQANGDAVAQAGKASQERIEAILTSEEAKGRTAQANHLAFKTSMSAEEAIGLMKVSSKDAMPGQTGQRARDAAGGLAMPEANNQGNGGAKADENPINSAGIYAKRAEQMTGARK